MKRVSALITSSFLLTTACGSFNVDADEPKSARSVTEAKAERSIVAPNAAVVYWQAFAAIPYLSTESKKLLDTATASTTAPFNDEIKPIIAQYQTSLHALRRARSISPCDWNLDLNAGPELLLPHLQKARDLGRVALLQARIHFEAGETDSALNVILDVFKMGRDCGCQPILIGYLVDVAIEKMATDVLAAHLPLLKPQQLELLAKSLQQLPPTSSVSMCVEWEERLFGDWFERLVNEKSKTLTDSNDGGKLVEMIRSQFGLESEAKSKPEDPEIKRKAELIGTMTVADIRESLKRLRSDYRELGAIAALPHSEQSARLKTFEDELNEARKLRSREDAQRYFSTLLLPTISMVLLREDQYQVRLGLLDQAIQIQLHGSDALEAVRSRKVEYKKTANGFELSCPAGTTTETVVVGKAS